MRPTDKRYPTPWRMYEDMQWGGDGKRYLIVDASCLILAHGVCKRVAEMILAAMNAEVAQ